MPVLIGVAALGVEVGAWYQVRRQMQSAADAAAVAAALTFSKGQTSDAAIEAAANRVVAGSGLTGFSCERGGGVNDNCVVRNPPTSGALAGQSGAFQVVLRRKSDTILAKFFLPEVAVNVSAVASTASQAYCFLALRTTGEKTFHMQNSSVTNRECGVAVNSNNTRALWLENSARINGPTYLVASRYQRENTASLDENNLKVSQAVVADPYSAVRAQFSTCNAGDIDLKSGAVVTLSAGRYCDVSIKGNAKVTLNPGVYYIDVKLSVSGGNTTLTGTGVTIVLMATNATMDIGGGAEVTLTAPTTGTFAGIAIMAPSNAVYLEQKIQNQTKLTITGALYFPSQKFLLENGGTIEGACTQVIAREIQIQNSFNARANCNGTGVKPIPAAGGGGAVTLVE